MLWQYIKDRNEDEIVITYDEVKNILGFEIDHSFLKYKSELNDYGFFVDKISIKDKQIKVKRKIKLDEEMKITKISGSRDYCILSFDNGDELKCNGELYVDGRFEIYKDYLELTIEEKIILEKIFNNYKSTHDSSVIMI